MSSSVVSQLNAKYQTYLQLYTWHYLNIRNGRDTKIVSLTNDGFIVNVREGKNEKQYPYTFSEQEKTSFRDSKTRTEKVLSQYIGPQFPPMGIHVINMWLIGLIALVPISLIQDYEVLVNAKGWVMKLFVREQYAIYYLLTLAIAHLGEMIYSILFLLPQIGFPMSKYTPWAFFTFVFGYPVLSRLKILHTIASGTNSSKKET